MTRAKHRPPPPPLLTRPRVAIADGALLTAALTAAALTVAPHTPQPTPTAHPTAVELREPTGHGGLGGPVAGPSFAPDVPVWTEGKGPVIVDGQALPRPTAVARVSVASPENLNDDAPVQARAAKPEPTPTPVAEPTPTEEPVATPEVAPTTEPVETTVPTVPPAEPTVVEVAP